MIRPTSRRTSSRLLASHVEKNKVDAERFGHLPTPAGAVKLWHWDVADDDESQWLREFYGTEHVLHLADAPWAADRVDVDNMGSQHADGAIDRGIYVIANSAKLNTGDARQLAALLLDAADELDRLTAG